jgi:lactate dehydrogenase-like 2-hydroxyacid dehydrogenase
LDPVGFASIAGKVRGIAARAMSTVTREFIAQLPALEIISVFGVGYDAIDVQAARERGIVVTHTPDVLTDDVADLCLGLILSVAREIPAAERFLRNGSWKIGAYRLARKVSDSRLGIIGLGRIGSAVARRAEGFGMSIAYTDLSQKPEVSYHYYASLLDLAANTDFLVAAAYGGPATRGLVNAAVLNALGPEGFLINIARGSLVDEPALVEALKKHVIRGAALDVFADEPNVPAELLTMDNVVLTPHMASGTAQTRQAMANLAFTNLEAYFAGKPVPAPIPR